MHSQLIQFVYLILIILALVMLANKLKIAYPIVLVVGGLLLSFTSLFSHVLISPDLVFFLFLPPLLYEAAWQTSWKEFWRWRRIIMSFAFPIVIITSCVIAIVSKALLPGFTLALGFLLGGIISPPDAVSATTIMKQVNAPKSLVSIIEGESLLNDASSLIVFRFALVAVITGQFHMQEVTVSFFKVIILGILIGLAVAFFFYSIHRWLVTTSSIEIVLSLVTPYCMYYAAEHYGGSGVLAVVSGGLFLSNKRQSMLTYRSRIESVNVWTNFVFVLNGLVFLLIGLQMPTITQQLEGGLSKAIGYGLTISLILILTRFACTLGASAFTRFMSRFITVADDNPGWKGPLVLGWSGMRGVVSLAAALSIPIYINEENTIPFPQRNLVLFITFVVILITLVLQGLTLPWIIKKIKLEDKYRTIAEDKQELIIQKKIAKVSLEYIEQTYEKEKLDNKHLKNLLERLNIDLNFFKAYTEEPDVNTENTFASYQRIYLELLEQQRKLLIEMNHKAEFDEDLIRKYLALVDIEEFKIREKLVGDNNNK